MNSDTLQRKLERYLNGNAMPSETRQIQTWLSYTRDGEIEISEKQKLKIEQEILRKIKNQTILLFSEAQKGE
jgi:hypothetical protein